MPPTQLARPDGPHGLITGTGLGKYRILERLRVTHNALVYKARDAMLDRLVTLKQLSPELIDDPVACGDFKREAQLLARLSGRSRHVTHVYELIADLNGLFIAEEYSEGDWLEFQISKKLLTADDAANLLRHACLALGTLQAERIVHRDASPTNWLVGRNGRLILSNFSTASREGDTVPPAIVHAKYASPEILLGEACDCRADLYSFGMILYEICVGRARLKEWCQHALGSPKPQEADWRAWQVDLASALPNARDLNPNLSDELAELLVLLTAKDIDDRIGSCRQILTFVQARLLGHATARRKAIAAPGDSQIIEIRRTSPAVAGAPPHASAFNLQLRDDQSTTTTPVVRSDAAPVNTRPATVAPRPGLPRSVPSRNIGTTPPRPVHRRRPRQPVVPPKPVAVSEPPRVQRKLGPVAAAVAIMLVTISASIYVLASVVFAPDGRQAQVAALVDGASEARNRGDLTTARRQLTEAAMLAKGSRALDAQYKKLNHELQLVDAQLAIQNDDFDGADAALTLAEQSGASPSDVSDVRNLLRSRREAVRIRNESEARLANNDFTVVELALPEYRRNAQISGLDVDALDRKLEMSRGDERYHKAVERANAALDAKEFDAALVAARDALSLRDAPESRRLRDLVLESKRQHDHQLRGDQAVRDRDFGGAEREYQAALEIMPNSEIEDRLRLATAGRLVVEANQALSVGDLLGCERKLKTSMWQAATSDAQSMIERLQPAFDAARMVEKANAAARNGDRAEAIRLLEVAVPKLPSPARKAAQAKLDQLRADS